YVLLLSTWLVGIVRVCPAEGRGCEGSTESHRLNRGRRYDHHRTLFLDRLVQHVHGSQMQGHRIFSVGGRSLHKAVGNFSFRLTQDDSRLPLTFRLRLPGHGVFQSRRDSYIAELDRLNGNTPGIGFLIEYALQLVAHHFAFGDHLRQLVATDRLSQRRLSTHVDGSNEVFHLEDRLLDVPNQPENDGVNVDWNSVTRQRGLR